MSIEGHIAQVHQENLEAITLEIEGFGKRMNEAMLAFQALLEEAARVIERDQIVQEDLPPIIDRHLGDVLVWLREAGHDV